MRDEPSAHHVTLQAGEMITVTRAVLPSFHDFINRVASIFESGQLTNRGPLQKHLEAAISETLRLHYVSLCNNGTSALQLALRLLGLQGKKIVTTPFSYVAGVSALLWEGCTPVFADIAPDTLCLDPGAVAAALAEHPDAAGILPVHVFGNACDVACFERISREHGIPCLYDGAHAFGSELAERSLLDFGDASICSFHATKLFHSVEGGCVVTHSEEAQKQMQLLRAFGHIGDTHISLGINAKMSELHAAMGLCLLPMLDEIIQRRQKITKRYDSLLDLTDGHLSPLGLRRPALMPGLTYNYAYYPVLFAAEEDLLRTKAALEADNIFPRRYFYPSLTRLPYLPGHEGTCPTAERTALTVLCLPLFPGLGEGETEQIVKIILRTLRQ